MGPVYSLTLRQLAGRWRLSIMLLLAAMPVFITAVMVRSPHAAAVRDFERAILGAMLAGAIAPLVVLAIAGAAFGNELEDRTLVNLSLSPLPRWKIALPKLLATITIAGPVMAASAFVTSWIAFIGDWRAAFAVAAATLVGVAMYAAAFVWLGLVSAQAIGVGLLYIVLWEGFFSGFVAGARMLSIRHYAIGLMHLFDPRRFAWSTQLYTTAAPFLAVVVIVGFTLLSIRRLRRMDIP